MVARDDVDFELREIDEDILDILEDARCTRKHLAALLGVSSDYIYQRIDLMQKLGLINIIHDGFYEIDYDPDDVIDERAREPVDDAGGDDLRDRAQGALDQLDVPGRDASTERNRRQAVMWAWDYLRVHGDATSSEIANATFGYFWDTDLGYSVSSRYPGYGLWDNCVRDALKQLPGVDAPGEKGNEWEFVEE